MPYKIIKIYEDFKNTELDYCIENYPKDITFSIIAGEHFLSYKIDDKLVNFYEILNDYILPLFCNKILKQLKSYESKIKNFAFQKPNYSSKIEFILISLNDWEVSNFTNGSNFLNSIVESTNYSFIKEPEQSVDFGEIILLTTPYIQFKDYLLLINNLLTNLEYNKNSSVENAKNKKPINNFSYYCKSIKFDSLKSGKIDSDFEIFKWVIYLSEIDFNFHDSNDFRKELFKLFHGFKGFGIEKDFKYTSNIIFQILKSKLTFLLYKCLFREYYAYRTTEGIRALNVPLDLIFQISETESIKIKEEIIDVAECSDFIFCDFVKKIESIYLKNLTIENNSAVKNYFDCHKVLKKERKSQNSDVSQQSEIEAIIKNNNDSKYDKVASDSLDQFYKRTKFKISLEKSKKSFKDISDSGFIEFKKEIETINNDFDEVIKSLDKSKEQIDYEPIITYVDFINYIANNVIKCKLDGKSKQEIIQLLSDNFNKAVINFETLFKNCKDKFYLPLYLPFEECLTKYLPKESSDYYTIHIDSSYTLPVDFDKHYNDFNNLEKEWFRVSNSVIIHSYHIEIEQNEKKQEEKLKGVLDSIEKDALKEKENIKNELNAVQSQSIQLMGVFATVIALITSFVAIEKNTSWKLHEKIIFMLSLAMVLTIFILGISVITLRNYDDKETKKDRLHYFSAIVLLLVVLLVVWFLSYPNNNNFFNFLKMILCFFNLSTCFVGIM